MRRLPTTTVIAVVLHAITLGFMATRPSPPRPAPAPPALAPQAIELEVVLFPPEAPGKLEVPAPEAMTTSIAPTLPPPPAHAAATRAPASTPAAAGDGNAGVGAGDAAPGSGGIAAPLGSGGVAAPPGSAVVAVVPDALPPPLVPRAIHARREVLEGPLSSVATAAGLSASSQVMSTVQRVARGDRAPRNGRGTLRIVVEEDGSVSRVTTQSPSWAAMAKALHAALAGRHFLVPRGAHGLVISFAVDATVTTALPVLTGEARADPSMPLDGVLQGSSPSDKPPQMAVIDPRALLPIPRHVVKVELLGEERR